MQGLDYGKAYRALPPYCLALMRNVPAEEQQSFARALSVVNEVKLRLLGLINVVGMDVLRDAVASLGAEIRYQQ